MFVCVRKTTHGKGPVAQKRKKEKKTENVIQVKIQNTAQKEHLEERGPQAREGKDYFQKLYRDCIATRRGHITAADAVLFRGSDYRF